MESENGREVYGRARRDSISWWAEAGYVGFAPTYSDSRLTRLGAKKAARRLKRKLARHGIPSGQEYV